MTKSNKESSFLQTILGRLQTALRAPPLQDGDDKPHLRVGLGGDVPIFPPLFGLLSIGGGLAGWAATGQRLPLIPPATTDRFLPATIEMKIGSNGNTGNNNILSIPTWFLTTAFRLTVTAVLWKACGSLIQACHKALREHAQTTPDFQHVPQLCELGPFAQTRNGMYVAVTGLTASLSVALNSGWMLLSAGVTFLYLNGWVVPAEERYLKQQFGVAYTDYCQRVPRWF